MKRFISAMRCRVCASLLLFLGLWMQALPAVAQPQDLVASGVSSLVDGVPAFGDPVYMWVTTPSCTESPGFTAGSPRGVAGDELSPALISRASPFVTQRAIFSFNPARLVGVCNPYRLISNVESDATHVYYVDNQGSSGGAALWKRDRSANPDDSSQLLVDLGTGITTVELEVFGQFVFAIVHREANFDTLVEYDKNTGAYYGLVELAEKDTLRNMQYDGRYLFWISADGLRRNDTTNGLKDTPITGYVRAYHALGYGEECDPEQCYAYAFVTYAIGNQLFEGDTVGGSGIGIPDYTSSDPNALILGITRDATRRFFVERRVYGGGFGQYEDRIYRLGVGPGTPDLIHGPAVTNGPLAYEGLRTDNEWLYFREALEAKLVRLFNDATAIQQVDLSALRIELTQGIQNAGNVVRLIEGKATTARVYVRSEQVEDSVVAGVTVRLAGSNTNGYLGTLEPQNIPKAITARTDPLRSRFADSFQFELPREWTTGGPLELTATVNPRRTVVEEDYSNNETSLLIGFTPSARLHVAYYNFIYPLNGILFYPTFAQIGESQRRMRRLYPVSEPGLLFTQPGLHFTSNDIVDLGMTAAIARTSDDCIDRYPKEKEADRNMCASDYAHARIHELRRAGAIRPETLPYANIPQPTCNGEPCLFPRGYASNYVGSGPSADANYAAHEIGHLLGRPHPTPGAATCGHSASDDEYPHADAKIDHPFLPQETRVAGLDRRPDGTYVFYDADASFDTMAYCNPNWISDYTYEYLYQFLAARSPALTAATLAGSTAVSLVAGDWLSAIGILDPSGPSGDFLSLRRIPEAVDPTPSEPGDFTIEQYDAGQGFLASRQFDAEPVEETPGRLAFDIVVPFEPGAAEVRIRENSTNLTLATHAISANAPTVANVDVPGSPGTVDGVVAVTWDAVDLDGDSLTFDVLASRDDGATFRPVILGLDLPHFELDTTLLGGGTNRLRVVATDGVLTGRSESDSFEVPPHAPVPVILNPADGVQMDWGQLVTLQAEVQDLQDEYLSDADIEWSDAFGPLGNGRTVHTDALRVGVNTITVTATNSLGEPGSASITVTVGDMLTASGPKFAPAPQAIAWQVANEESSVQSAALEVENAGSGTPTFNIVSDSEWVSVNGAQQLLGLSLPASITVNADPAGVDFSSTGEAVLTLTNLADPADVVEVPVYLSRGDAFNGPRTIESCDIDTGECVFLGTTTTTTIEECGNGEVEGTEECDGGTFVRGDACGRTCAWVACGDTDDGGTVNATDGLNVLRVAVGIDTCAGCVCNVDAQGNVTASDALRVVKTAVGTLGLLACTLCE